MRNSRNINPAPLGNHKIALTRQKGGMKLYGLVGFPLSHTLSPVMHNAAFMHLGMKAIYLPLPIEPRGFTCSARYLLEEGHISGLNVTIPYKERIMKFLDSLGDEARLMGAVNTVSFRGSRRKGDNTDGRGFIRALTRDLGVNPKGKSVFILGAGGAARAIGCSLALEGASGVVFADKLASKAKRLVFGLKKVHSKCEISCVPLKDIGKAVAYSEIIVNATPVGLKPKDPPAIRGSLLKKGQVVYDCIYNPSETKLLKTARQKGLKRMNGLGMLLYQGAESFRIWTGRRAPVDVMRRVLARCRI